MGAAEAEAVVDLSEHAAYDDPALMTEARQAGAHAYLVKGCRAGELVEVIERAASGHGDG